MEKLVESFLSERKKLNEQKILDREKFKVNGVLFEMVNFISSFGEYNSIVKRVKEDGDENVYHIAVLQKNKDDQEERQYRFLFDGVYTSYPPVWEARGTPENLAKLCLKYDEQGPR